MSEDIFQETICTVDLSNEVVALLLTMNISIETISAFIECGINKVDILKIMHSKDIDEVFSKLGRGFIGEKIIFRHELQKWRKQNKVRKVNLFISLYILMNFLL